ncbi:forkhead box protein L [Sarotherodon galilaeus]
MDGLGIWTGKRQFRIKLEADTNAEDGYRHPPAVFSIGANRGFLVYAGQPPACRKCGSTEHVVEQCDQMKCRSCGKFGHITRDCKEPKRCHLCDSEAHIARDCTKPRPYAVVVKAGPMENKCREEEKDFGEGTSSLEPQTGVGNQADDDKVEGVEEESERHEEKGERRSDLDDESLQQGEEPQQRWEVVGKPRRKTAKRRRKASPAVSPGHGKQSDQGIREEVLGEGEYEEGYMPRGTQTECMHTPLSVLISDGDVEDEGENDEKSEDSFITSLLSHANGAS